MIGGYIGGIGTVTYVENGTTAYVTVTEDADTLSSAAVLALKATLDSTEDADTLTSAGVLRIAATADVTEDADTLTALGIYPQSLGTLDVTEGEDTLDVLGLLPIAASADLVEDSDTASSYAVISNVASLDCTEEDDTLTATIRFDDVLVTVLRPRVSNITLSRSSPYQITSARPNYSVITA